MAERTAISWCDATFNPWYGCTKVSPACDHCYAERLMDTRMHKVQWGGPRVRTSAANWKQPLRWNAQAEREGRRYRVFCSSLADVFDNQVPPEWREDLFELIRVTPHLDWLLLTKRPQNIVRMVREQGSIAGNGTRYLPDNVSLGTTAEDQTRADQNLPALLRTRIELGARVLFVSIEPMLGPVDLRQLRGFHNGCTPQTHDCLSGHSSDTPWGYVRDKLPDPFGRGRIDWVICGGESGPQARPMHPDWARSLRDQCAAAGVPFHLKQITERGRPVPMEQWPADLRIQEFPA